MNNMFRLNNDFCLFFILFACSQSTAPTVEQTYTSSSSSPVFDEENFQSAPSSKRRGESSCENGFISRPNLVVCKFWFTSTSCTSFSVCFLGGGGDGQMSAENFTFLVAENDRVQITKQTVV